MKFLSGLVLGFFLFFPFFSVHAAMSDPVDAESLLAEEGEYLQSVFSPGVPLFDARTFLDKIVQETAKYSGYPVTRATISSYFKHVVQQNDASLKQKAMQAVKRYSAEVVTGQPNEDDVRSLMILMSHVTSANGACMPLEEADHEEGCVWGATPDIKIAKPWIQIQQDSDLATFEPSSSDVQLTALQPVFTFELPEAPASSLAAPQINTPKLVKVVTTWLQHEQQHGDCGPLFFYRHNVPVPKVASNFLDGRSPYGTDPEILSGDGYSVAASSGKFCYGQQMLWGDYLMQLLISYGTSRDTINVWMPFAFDCLDVLGNSACEAVLAGCLLAQGWFGADYEFCITHTGYYPVDWPIHGVSMLESGLIQGVGSIPAPPAEERPGFIASGPDLRTRGMNYGTNFQYPAGAGVIDQHMYPLPTNVGLAPLSGEYKFIEVDSWKPNIFYVAAESANVLHNFKCVTSYAKVLCGDAWTGVYGSDSYYAQLGYVNHFVIHTGVGVMIGQGFP